MLQTARGLARTAALVRRACLPGLTAARRQTPASPWASGSMACCSSSSCKHNDGLSAIMQSNRQWAAEMLERDPEFFNRLVEQQNPEYLWIGCSDSRVPANQILGMDPGEIFVQRNVGNQAMHTDLNLMSCLEYAVKSLKVKTIILCGHYNCGAVKAALQLPHCTPGLVNCWISDIRECRNQAERELLGLDPEQQLARLCELNVLRQVFHVATSPVVAGAWAEGQELHLYGLIYDVADGHLRKLAGPISGDDGYERKLDSFVSGGLRVTRCPDTQRLRLSASDEVPASHAHQGLLPHSASKGSCCNGSARCSAGGGAAGQQPGSGAGGGEGGCCGEDEGCEPGGALGYAALATPSELMSSINSINLAESIAKHKHWANRSARTSTEALPSAAVAAAHLAQLQAQVDAQQQQAAAAQQATAAGAVDQAGVPAHAGVSELDVDSELPQLAMA